jgi:hypothetical protein
MVEVSGPTRSMAPTFLAGRLTWLTYYPLPGGFARAIIFTADPGTTAHHRPAPAQ